MLAAIDGEITERERLCDTWEVLAWMFVNEGHSQVLGMRRCPRADASQYKR